MVAPLALIVDDEPDIRELLSITLRKMSVQTIEAHDLKTAVEALKKHEFNLCLTDMRLPDGSGIELVEHIQTNFSHIPVAVITAYGSMELAVSALKSGAFDFVSKPVDIKVLRALVSTALNLSVVEREALSSQNILLGNTNIINQLREKIKKLARSQAPVYISGESGTGKELVARLIHELGPRSTKPFIAVNCGAIPEHLMESEFFGHKKGSFTGAVADKAGLFQAAHGGTLFLDEVADLPLLMQVKLLRAIQEKAIRPIGDSHEIQVDVRILSATHKSLAELVKTDQFRQDLYYRINVIELSVPSLRDRPGDIPLLVDHILAELAQRNGSNQTKISADALNKLMSYAFPGNVRELENILERAMTLCENNIIYPKDLFLQQETLVNDKTLEKNTTELNSYLDQIEKDKIMAALEKTQWNRTKAAKLLGITFRALRYRLKKWGVDS